MGLPVCSLSSFLIDFTNERTIKYVQTKHEINISNGSRKKYLVIPGELINNEAVAKPIIGTRKNVKAVARESYLGRSYLN